MQKLKAFLPIAVITLAACNSTEQNTMLQAPKAEKIPFEITTHGQTRVDNYYWMNQREDQKVIDFLNAENSYLEASMAHTKTFQESLFEELKGRIKEDDESVPTFRNGYFYYTKYEKGGEYPIVCRKQTSLDNPEEVMLNVNIMAEGFDYYQLGGSTVSTNNNMLAFSVDTVSRRIYTIYFKNLETGEILKDFIPNTTGGITWANDNKTVFYTKQDESLRSYKIFRHVVGTDYQTDVEIFHEKDVTFNCGIGKTKSDKYLMIGSYSTVSSEFMYLDANNPTGEFALVQPRRRDHLYSVYHFGDHFYIKTNKDEAKNYKLMKVSTENPSENNWVEAIPHREDVLLEDAEFFKDYVVLSERKNGLVNIRVINEKAKKDFYLAFNDPAYAAYTVGNFEFNTNWLRYAYNSMTTPNSVIEYNMETGEEKLLKRSEVVGGHNPEDYQSERLWATTEDGTEIPISIVYKKDKFKKDGTSPVLLYGYGSYGYSLDPYFSSTRLSLLNRGFAFAIAHVRGGEELGRQWYEDGKLLKKKNTFTDFIACGNFLVNQKYAATDKLFASGGSAGGLLMGAIMNFEPQMWAGIIANVPFVDVVTTMLDESIPLTTGEFDEWGNPKDEVYYNYMLSYSPYDNVEPKNYPPTLVITGLHDSQVQYWEPAKWVAKLRELKTDNNPLYLKTDMSAGHGGASGRFESLKETALEYTFLLDLAGKMN